MRNDFIEVFPQAVPAQTCRAIIEQFERCGQELPGRVGGGVLPDLKHSSDIEISGKPEWLQAEQALNGAVMSCLLAYLRRYPYALIAPLMLQVPAATSEKPQRLVAEDFASMDDSTLGGIISAVMRPGRVNLQRYRGDQGGYPYWHCELYPKDASAETLHRTLLWTVYLNEEFSEGETEFLYQERKIVPATGSVLIAPTAFTHTHRGNKPRRGDKYIATSWVLFQRAELLFAR